MVRPACQVRQGIRMTVTVPLAADWMWGAPILVLTVLIHSFGLFAIRNAIGVEP
jgi:hypothetical protein